MTFNQKFHTRNLFEDSEVEVVFLKIKLITYESTLKAIHYFTYVYS